VWPAFERHWEKVVRPYLEIGLNHFLPQAQFLTNSQALFDRGRSLIAPDLSLIDPEEAIQCFRKAAELGHAQAQVSLGHFYEAGQGVPKDYTEALQWYRKAAEQKGKHALCSIGVLYQFGKGVPQDLDEAATWYHRELNTSDGCICAQMNLGQILETKSAPEEALKWYRLAAAGGMPPAQARLGDMLSDGLSTKPDYVEACQWLSLAAAAGDKVSAIRLRRVKTKLTSEQWNAVDQRVTTISRQLKEKEKADAKAANP
jgi:TPR repeat protein